MRCDDHYGAYGPVIVTRRVDAVKHGGARGAPKGHSAASTSLAGLRLQSAAVPRSVRSRWVRRRFSPGGPLSVPPAASAAS